MRKRKRIRLLSVGGYTIDETANIFKTDRRAVSSRIDAWVESGFDGSPDSPRSGRPEKLTVAEKNKAVEPLRENPRSVKTVIAELAVIRDFRRNNLPNF
ncbi:hypothetical protein QUF90_24615 [Desulfococcaceae bacterium HSG9]|nr:hypothetical protein [Desulfococcaceae bacterium HSG9]